MLKLITTVHIWFWVFFSFFPGVRYWTSKASEESRSNVERKDVGHLLEFVIFVIQQNLVGKKKQELG